MNKNKKIEISGTALNKIQMQQYLEKIGAKQTLISKSEKITYPIPILNKNYELIKETYNILNEDIKNKIDIYPAGEWILDNFYIIEETVKVIKKELTLKKYQNFIGVGNGKEKGFARIYVLAYEIIVFSENKIEKENLEECIKSYQKKKTLNMEEIWNIGMFLQIAIIDNIAQICKNILNAQSQRRVAKNIVERIIESKKINKIETKKIFGNQEIKYPFIEYMSYLLKRYGKIGQQYIDVLEDIIEMKGTSITEVIKKEHYKIAIDKVAIGDAITSIKKIQRMDFQDIFEKINGVEEILKKDPANVYEKMDYKSKELYRNTISKISKKTKISEIYIAKKILEIAKNHAKYKRESHIGYYLIGEGYEELNKEIGINVKRKIKVKNKVQLYILIIALCSFLITMGISIAVSKKIETLNVLLFLFLIVPVSEFVIQIIQNVLQKIVKPQMIPKLNMEEGLNEEVATQVVIPTIINSVGDVKKLAHKLEVFYLANQSKNIYFTILGDCKSSNIEIEELDHEIVKEGMEQIEKLNKKYQNEIEGYNIFNFIYRKRKWNEFEDMYIGWERKRGLLNQFNEYILGNISNPFLANSFEKEALPKIKYVITLDSDTKLPLNAAFELVGAMEHILNKPIIDKEKNIVINGYGIIQPRVGVELNVVNKTLFSKIFAGSGGTDLYTNAISDIYQDNFGEGIFTGKGIYNLEVYSKVLKDRIPENTVLSHDLLEGNYLRCGLATDILLIDGYPNKYFSFMNRLSRWTRGDWQIVNWMKKNTGLNLLSRYKIFDNLRRSLIEITLLVSFFVLLIFGNILDKNYIYFDLILIVLSTWNYIVSIISQITNKKENVTKYKKFEPEISGIKGEILKGFLTFSVLPYKAMVLSTSICKAIYRKNISKRKMLEWMTSEEAEKTAKSDLKSYIVQMSFNILIGVLFIILSKNILEIVIGTFWFFGPILMCFISKNIKQIDAIKLLNKEQIKYVKMIGMRTWEYFENTLTKENNYLVPDNYQEDRKDKFVLRTSSTNIGLSLIAVISAIDLNFIEKEKGLELIKNIINSIEELPKMNGHLYNWYNIKTKQPLIPRYISTVDNGNFIGYMYVVKAYIENQKIEEKENLLNRIKDIINQMNFEFLYNPEHGLFSIGFNVEENKITDSYYDLLASEARQTSFIAIAKKDIESKHWKNLSRTLTSLNKYKGLISWSGTAFEYLMPNLNIPVYNGSIIKESTDFMIMSQLEYAKKLKIPWGISESAFNLKDLQGNYQYKAFGIPWLGLKRGLADEMVVTPYGSILAISEIPREVINNLRKLERYGMLSRYGFYEAIDFTPIRMKKGKKEEVVKTYMAHHQALILGSINNLMNNNVINKLFLQNPEIEAIDTLLQERMPVDAILTKEDKEKIKKVKYEDGFEYSKQEFTKINPKMILSNVISNENYTIAINQKGIGVSKYKDIYINRFKSTDNYNQGIFFYFKNLKNKNIWSSIYEGEKNNYKIEFTPDKIKQEKINGNIKTTIKTTIDPNEAVEIRRVTIENLGEDEELLEIYNYFEPVLSKKEQDYAHKAFNKLFLNYKYDENTNSLIITRRARDENEKSICMNVGMSFDCECIGEIEYEIDREKFIGRKNLITPEGIEKSKKMSKRIGLTVDPIVAFKRTIKIEKNTKINIDLIISVSEEEKVAKENYKKYLNVENAKRVYELARAKVEAESRYLGINGKDIEIYQKMLGLIIFNNYLKREFIKNIPIKKYTKEDLWKYGISGDIPIILVKVKDVNDSYVIKENLKAYEFFRNKNINTELVIIDEEKHSYENYLREEINNVILDSQMWYLKNQKNGIFNIYKSEISQDDYETLEYAAEIIIDSKIGGIKENLKEKEEKFLENYKDVDKEKEIEYITREKVEENEFKRQEDKSLQYNNSYGGFSSDGKEYHIKISRENNTPMIWSNIMANEKFGTIVTERCGGYTWYKNSRLNRITCWNNDQTLDIPNEIIYIKDMKSKKVYSIGINEFENIYNITYGFGYTKINSRLDDLEEERIIFVPKDDSIKIDIIKFKNNSTEKKKIKLYYYANLALDEDEIKSKNHIYIKKEENQNLIYAQNLYNDEFKNTIAFVGCSEKIKSYTGNKEVFIGEGGIDNPDGLKKDKLIDNGYGTHNCISYEIEIEIESYSEKEIAIMLGAGERIIDIKDVIYKYSKIENCKNELKKIIEYWNNITSRIQVKTQIESINILLNGWLVYQTMQSRLLARSGYYQSGGAIGFRDQLQDCLALKYINPQILKDQIIKNAKHQFEEGDVLHWWHDENNRGIRTRISDDRMWLVYAILEYIEFTGDKSILDEEVAYLNGKKLETNQNEIYDKYEESNKKETLYNHCKKAIEISMDFGKNGLPKIGTGDWNDGFNKIGEKQKGESIWLGFFMYYILEKFIKIAKKKDISKYIEIKEKLRKNLNNNGWDGRWYRRAYTDENQIIGGIENTECKIDSIVQSWSVISEAGDNDKKYIAMESLENHLVDKENGIIKLLDPPFENGNYNPGYIKSYLPGTRENGGQYTHAAIWAIWAFSKLGFYNKALEFYQMINPIEHSKTREEANKYKVEPYVIAADIYGSEGLTGRGGWTWYTGSASWYYKIGLENILGFKIVDGKIQINSEIPDEIKKELEIKYRYGKAIYNIKIRKKDNEKSKILVNGVEVSEIKLEESEKIYNVEVFL